MMAQREKHTGCAPVVEICLGMGQMSAHADDNSRAVEIIDDKNRANERMPGTQETKVE